MYTSHHRQITADDAIAKSAEERRLETSAAELAPVRSTPRNIEGEIVAGLTWTLPCLVLKICSENTGLRKYLKDKADESNLRFLTGVVQANIRVAS